MKLRQLRYSRLLVAGFLLAAVVAALAPAANSQSPVPTADAQGKGTPPVKVSAVVLDEKNNFVGDLRAEDFVLTENGVPQPVASFAREDLPLSYTLLVDNTRSLSAELDHVLKTGEEIVAGMRPQDEMSLVRFVRRDRVELLQDFTRNQNALTAAIDQMYTEGGDTALLEALYVSAEAVAARAPDASRRRALVVMTDGGERDNQGKLDEVLNLLRRQRVRVFVFGLTEAVDKAVFDQVKGGRKKSRELLETLARETGGRAVFPKKPSEFADAAAALNRELQMPEYVLGYSPSRRAHDGKHVAVKLTLADSALTGRGKLQLHVRPQPQ